ncbi:MAG: methionine--tRNA ligase [Coriobacteriia bacterium]|nr:methionine--tRNA ligase [Coriobacteriia bacterium]
MTIKDTFYITTPIYYVNAVPHLGTAYTTVASDALARFMRSNSRDVWFLTGLDEHGQKIEQAAHAKGKTAQDWVDEIAPKFKHAWQALNITYDDFIRTTEPRHFKGVQRFFEELYKKDYIYKDTYRGYYCVPDETFFSDEQLAEFAEERAAEELPSTHDDGSPLCPDCTRPLEYMEEENLFFKLSAFEQRLLDYYEAHPEFIQPEIRRNEVLSFVKSGLKDLSVSRTTFSWGVPISFAPGHISYVWVDALLNYITALGYGSDAPEDKERFAQYWPAQVQFIGKDIIRFHCVIWPAMLMAAGLELPQTVFAHGFLLTKGEKMSKSKGNAMDPNTLIENFSADGYRYYFLRDVQFGTDGSISLERMLQVYNADLANSWGNLCSRALNMTAKYLDGITPELSDNTTLLLSEAMGNPLAQLVDGGLHRRYATAFEAVDFLGAMDVVMELVDAANLYIEQSAPWALAKAAAGESEVSDGPTQADRLSFVLYNILESIRIIAVLFAPVMPTSSAEVWKRLGLGSILDVDNQAALCAWGGLAPHLKTTIGEPLFMRLAEDDLLV